MASELEQKTFHYDNLQNKQPSQLLMQAITQEYENLMEKFSKEIFIATQIKKDNNEKRSEKLKNIPTFTNLLQKTQLDR